MGRVIFGGIIGGIIAFVWMFVSWAILPWHDMTLKKFKNEGFVAWVVKENAPKDGVYVIPHIEADQGNYTPEEVKQAFEKQKAAMTEGPFVYMQVKKKGMDPTSFHLYLFSFLTYFVGALILSYLLLQVNEEAGYLKRLFFCILFGLGVGIIGMVPDWNWFAAGGSYTLVMIADLIITWFLAGLVLSAIVKPRAEPERLM